MNDDFAAVSVIRFSDGGPPSAQLLHRGTKESCIETAELISALSYSGDRPVKDASIVWIPAEQWDAAYEQAIRGTETTTVAAQDSAARWNAVGRKPAA